MMTATERKVRNEGERMYLADLLRRYKKVACPSCYAPRGKPCIHLAGPRRYGAMAGVHGERKDEANRMGFVKGPRYWRHKKS